MLTIKYQSAFKKDYKRVKKRGYDTRLLAKVVGLLAEDQTLPPRNTVTAPSAAIIAAVGNII